MENPNPLSDIEHWEDDLLRRYPDPETKKNKAEFRNYEDSERDSTVREFYRLNHKYQTYDFVCQKEEEFLKFNKRQMSIWDVIENSSDTNKSVKGLATKLNDIRSNDIEKNSVAESLGLVIRLLEQPLQNLSGGGSAWQLWKADLAILQTLAQPFSSVNDFLLNIQMRNVDRSEDEDSVRFSSIHAAKGLEWDYVFVIGLVEFWFPMKLAIADQGNDEEERRLFYVASTRSRRELYLSTYTSNVNPYGRVMSQETSRFIDEVRNYLNEI